MTIIKRHYVEPSGSYFNSNNDMQISTVILDSGANMIRQTNGVIKVVMRLTVWSLHNAMKFWHNAFYSCERNPFSKVDGTNMGPSGAGKTQVGPMFAPWTILSGNAFYDQFWGPVCPFGIYTTNVYVNIHTIVNLWCRTTPPEGISNYMCRQKSDRIILYAVPRYSVVGINIRNI